MMQTQTENARTRGWRRLRPGGLWRAVVLALLAATLLAGAAEDQEAFQFAEGLFIRKDYESAIEEYQALLKAHPESAKAPTAMYRIGEAQRRLGQHAKAAAAYQLALKAYPDAADAGLGAYNLGGSLLALDQPREAVAAYATAIAKGDATVRQEALVAQAATLMALNDLPPAIKALERLMTDFPDSTHAPEALFSLGWALSQEGDLAGAETRLREHLTRFPDAPNAAKVRLALSDVLVALQKLDEAAATLQPLTAEKQGDTAEAAALRLAWVTFRAGDKAGAAKAFADFARTYPEAAMRATALFNVGICHYDLKQYEQAAKAFETLRKDHPQDPASADARTWLGISYFELGKHAQARELLTAVIADETTPADRLPVAIYTLAEAARAEGESAIAIAAYERLIREYPQSPDLPLARYSLATLQAAETPDAAIKTLQDLLAAEAPAATAREARFALAEYLYRQKRYADAVATLEPLVAADAEQPAPAPALYRYAWAKYDLQQFTAAQAAFARLAAMDSEFRAEARFMTGRGAEAAGDLEAAIGAYRQAIAAAPKPAADDAFTEKAIYRLSFLIDDRAALQENVTRYTTAYPQGEFRAPLTLRLAELQLRDGQVEAASANYQAVLTLTEDPALVRAAWYGVGWCALRQENPAAATEAFAKVGTEPAADPMVRDARLQLAEIAYAGERLEQAAGLYAPLVQGEDAAAVRAAYMLAWTQRRLGQTEKAAAGFRAFVQAHPQSEFAADAAIRYAEAARETGQTAEARKLLESVREQAPAELREELLQLYADLLVQQEDWKTLLAVCAEMEKAYPDSPHAYLVSFRLGLANRALGLLDEAEAQFRRTVKQTDTIEAARAQFNIGAIYASRENWAEAAKQYVRVDVLYDYPELAPRALYHAVQAFTKAGPDYERRARTYHGDLKERFPESEWTKKADALLAE